MLKKFFSNKEAVFYSNFNDLIKKLKYYNSNIAQCRKIAKNGYLKFHKIFSSEEICNYILKKIGLKKNLTFEILYVIKPSPNPVGSQPVFAQSR